ncbi:efflux RND transporter permease subunit [Paenibacillus contaminans]|uniref:AcrB/AcrD/AcrF family protein n=1 Tax=Paenibacillus contaminans TaxID=450362 RepID=A0A329MRS9_9BACL|nr:efflux RND transporter permease subunit [Paenibacillus contaminans]RAV22056.1 AcrB/AcrD/AcrF family protein [Paenibacillus contaminans]
MRGIINFSLNNKFAVWLLTIIITVAGLYAGTSMKQETLPNLDIPILTVTGVYPGASPEQVVEELTKPLEQRLKNLNGVSQVDSTSMENVSSIIIQYDYSKDLDKATTEVRDALAGFELPKGVQAPSINRISLNAFPVISLSVSGEGKSLEDLTSLVTNEIKPAIDGISGVASVEISGQHVKNVELAFNKEKMASLGITEDTVKGIIQGSALKVPLGVYQMGKEEKTVVVDGNIVTLDDLKNLNIPAIPSSAGGAAAGAGMGMGAPGAGAEAQPGAGQGGAGQNPLAAGIPTVKLSEIADVNVVGKAESISRTNGSESIGIQIVKAVDANTVEVVNKVKDEAAKIEKERPGVKLTTMLDQGKPIEESVNTMLSKAAFGALFAVIIIMLFLRNIRTTIISVISIPLSLLIGVLLLNQMDITLNIMTLGAMTVAIGRVVDDSIVVIENIYRRMSLQSEKLKGKELIREATREMFMPIMSSTIVTIAVFLPLGTVSGPIGQLFMPFALTMVFALLASLVVAVTVVPMLGHSMFKNGLKNKNNHDEKPGALGNTYKRLLNWSLNHKAIVFGLAIVVLVGSLFLIPLVGTSFLPEEKEKYTMITYSPAPGELVEDVEKKSLEAEKLILKREGLMNMQYSVGGKNPMSPGPSKSALFYIQYKNNYPNFEEETKLLLEDLRKLEPAGGEWNTMDMSGGFGGGGLSLSVFGESLDDIKPVVDQIQGIMANDSTFEKVENTISKSYDQYTLVADQQKLSKFGLVAGQIAMKLSPVRDNPALTTVKADGKQLQVFIQVDKKSFNSIEDIKNTTVTSPLGMEVPLKDIVEVQEGASPNTISRKDGVMHVDIKANITTANVGKASSDLQAKVDELKLPDTVKVEFGGVTEQLNETFKQLGLAMAAAVAIVYLVLVITFGGAMTPFAILFSLPFTAIGALVGLLFAGETISAAAMMGALMLIGIVVTNAIVLLDRVIHKEREGLTTREALLEAAGTRLRPILMTALATIGALLPLAFGFESSGIISKGLGVTVIGGLTSSTLLTLLIVPIVYEFLAKFGKKRRRAPLQTEV